MVSFASEVLVYAIITSPENGIMDEVDYNMGQRYPRIDNYWNTLSLG